MKDVELAYKDLKNTIRLFSNNKVVVNESIDVLISSLVNLKK